jgi:hypothetical protein
MEIISPETYFRLIQTTIERNGGTELLYLKLTRKHFIECITAQSLVEGKKVDRDLAIEYNQILTDIQRKRTNVI